MFISLFTYLIMCYLLQVAHFYNTIDQQMIPSQRPMMLGLALAFEQVIKVVLFCCVLYFYCHVVMICF